MSDQAVRDLTAILSLGVSTSSSAGTPAVDPGGAASAQTTPGTKKAAQRASHIFFPTYEQNGIKEAREKRGTWHTRTRLGPKREGLLVDPGAHDNLTGSKWAERQERLALEAGVSTQYRPMREVLNVEGVGNGRQQCAQFGRFPIALPAQERESAGIPAVYTARIVPDPDIPALLGLRSLRQLRALLDIVNNRIHFLGPGDATIQLPPGTRTYNLEESESGHLMLPVSEFQQLAGSSGGGAASSTSTLNLFHNSSQ